MNRFYRSKTQPVYNQEKEGLPISWALVPKNLAQQQGRDSSQARIKLPKIKINMDQNEKQLVNCRILKMKRVSYDPIGCSKSLRLQKVRLRKKLEQKSWLQKYQQTRHNDSFLSQISN